MACHYEEEIYEKEGKMDKCGCPECPYKTPTECYEGNRTMKNKPIDNSHFEGDSCKAVDLLLECRECNVKCDSFNSLIRLLKEELQ